MKKCTVCKKEKSPAEFNIQRNGTPDGLTYKCKPCASAYTRGWSLKNKERIRAAARERYLRNPDRYKASAKAARLRNPERYKQAHKKWARKNERTIRNGILRRLYGLSLEAYEAMFKSQNGGCKICGKQNLDGKRLFVDHNHDTGTVRGLLCNNCNAGVGRFFDDPSLLESAIKYLKDHKSKESV